MRQRIFFILISILAITLSLMLWNAFQRPEIKNSMVQKFLIEQLPVEEVQQVKQVMDEPFWSPTPVSFPNPEIAAEVACWEKIDKQVRPSKIFLDENRHFINSVVGEWYYLESSEKNNLRENSVPGKFFLALARSGFLSGRVIEQDDQEALRLLDEVYSNDPENSAPLLYMMMIQKRLGNDDLAAQLLATARKTSRFDSYLLDFSRSLFERVKTAEDLMAAYEIWYQAPVPDYVSLSKFMKNQNPLFLSQQLMADGLRENTKLSDIEWVPVEYATGRSMRGPMKDSFPTHRELLDRKTKGTELDVDNFITFLKRDCDVSGLTPLVKALQDQLREKRIEEQNQQ